MFIFAYKLIYIVNMKNHTKNVKIILAGNSIFSCSSIMPKYVLESLKIKSLIDEEKCKLELIIGKQETSLLLEKLIKESKEQLGVNSDYILNGLIQAQYKL